jgi:hypothetical protein
MGRDPLDDVQLNSDIPSKVACGVRPAMSQMVFTEPSVAEGLFKIFEKWWAHSAVDRPSAADCSQAMRVFRAEHVVDPVRPAGSSSSVDLGAADAYSKTPASIQSAGSSFLATAESAYSHSPSTDSQSPYEHERPESHYDSIVDDDPAPDHYVGISDDPSE